MIKVSLYIQCLDLLKESKKSGNKEDALQALANISSTLLSVASSRVLDYTTFSGFIYDQDLILPIDKEIFSQNSADQRVTSRGLLAEVIELAGIDRADEIAQSVKTAIYDLHTALSSKKENVESGIKQLRDAVSPLNEIL